MEEELRQSGSGREELPNYRFQSPPSRSGPPVLPVSDSLLDRLTALVEKHKKVWTTNIMQLYQDEYGVELQLKTYGFKDLSQLVDILEKQRPIDVRSINLFASRINQYCISNCCRLFCNFQSKNFSYFMFDNYFISTTIFALILLNLKY